MKKLRAIDKRVLRIWLPLAFVITAMAGLVYGLNQNSLRMTANDPQIQLAEDIASSLSTGSQPDTIVPPNNVDMRSSLAPFIIIYDTNDQVISGTGYLNSKNPHVPPGVLVYTAQHQEERLTWQPDTGVRIAAVTHIYRTNTGQVGFVLVGRNLREVEKREDNQIILTALAWSVTMLGSLGLCFVLTNTSKK